MLTPPQILDRLAQRLDLLKGGRDAEARQQTLRATIEWSHDLLADDEKQLFARLSVFAGGCTLDAAEEIVEADVDRLQSLVDKSLVRRTGERFWMLETIGEFARERLAASDDADAIGRRHAEWFLALAEEAEPFLKGAEQAVWLQRLEDEHDNLRASLDWFFDHGDVDARGEARGDAVAVLVHARPRHGGPPLDAASARRRPGRTVGRPAPTCSTAPATSPASKTRTRRRLALLEASFACAKEVGATATAAIAAAVLCSMRAETTSSTRRSSGGSGRGRGGGRSRARGRTTTSCSRSRSTTSAG